MWLQGATHVRPKLGQGSESFKLVCVRSKDADDPAHQWWTASPMGEFTMTMENPDGFGYVVPGAEYRVTIERIRGPRVTVTTAPPGVTIANGSGNTAAG